jgi:endonuclease YncB( thermonuclease family)
MSRLFLILTCALLASPAAARTLSGTATVVDGDSLEIAGQRVRLFGIDAPEARQSCDRDGQAWPCGAASTERLRSLIGSERVACTGDEFDQYGRLLAVCSLAGMNLNQAMVADGWATAYRRYSEAYVVDEGRARAARLGLWSSSFEAPGDYRAEERQAGTARAVGTSARIAAPTNTSGCTIKGNRNRRGEWIYHLPGMPYYDQTRAEEMFCSEAQAQSAGYRRSKAHW